MLALLQHADLATPRTGGGMLRGVAGVIARFHAAVRAAQTYERLDSCSETELARRGVRRRDVARIAARELHRP